MEGPLPPPRPSAEAPLGSSSMQQLGVGARPPGVTTVVVGAPCGLLSKQTTGSEAEKLIDGTPLDDDTEAVD